MANIKSIGGNPIVLDASGIAAGAVTPDKLADIGGITAGAALGITGGGGTAAAWLQRTSTSDGPTTIRGIHGNTIVQDGELVSVQMEGIETTGFNQWDEQTDEGIWNDNGTMSGSSAYICCKNKIPVFPGQTYYIKKPASVTNIYMKGYDANGVNGIGLNLPATSLLTIPDGVYFITFAVQKAQYGTTYNHDICVNLSDPTRNGEYEPYWSSQRLIDVATYFPDGMRSAGSKRDELTSTEAIMRVGAVDLGTLKWMYGTTSSQEEVLYANVEAYHFAPTNPNVTIPITYTDAYITSDGNHLRIIGTGYTDPAAFKTAMNGVYAFISLATPTVTPIDPPLNMTYRTEQGGTERVMVPTGELSAPPTIVTAHGYTAESLRDAALSAIAPVENSIASTNYGIGSYLVHDGQLCKVTTAIATGEAITIGTNVTATTVMAEVIALIAQ